MSTENTQGNDDPKEDQLGENAGNDLQKGSLPTEHKKDDDELVHTVVPDNDSGAPGPPAEEGSSSEEDESSNKEAGPSGENL